MLPMDYLFGAGLSIVCILIHLIKIRFRRRSISHLPGPPSASWLAGNLRDLQAPENSVGDADFAWVAQYGTAFKIRGPFGKDLLYLADPKGLQHVLNTGAYNFPRPRENRSLALFLLGPGLVFAEGGQHARHRKVLNPAFSYSALRAFLPLFFQTAEKLSGHWKRIVQGTGSPSAVVDVSGWLSRMALDIIGGAAFDHNFNVLDNMNDELAQALDNLLSDAFARPSDTTIAAQAVMNYLPLWIYRVVLWIPTKNIKRLAHYMSTARLIAKRLVIREREAMNQGRPASKDMMSVLVRADGHEDPKKRLSEDETYAQMTTLMMAGHETTACSIMWLLYEVAKRPHIQQRIREEIKSARAAAAVRGEEVLNVADLESMNFTLATIKETLRLHPVGPWLRREAGQDEVVPLSSPLRANSSHPVASVPISKGQEILVSICAYNRLESIWGPDADQWRPERFIGTLNDDKVGLGVVSNLATFSSGLRNCIGWRFALLEMQAVLVQLLETFEFALPDVEIIRVFAIAMTPMVRGQTERGAQMPLRITPIS